MLIGMSAAVVVGGRSNGCDENGVGVGVGVGAGVGVAAGVAVGDGLGVGVAAAVAVAVGGVQSGSPLLSRLELEWRQQSRSGWGCRLEWGCGRGGRRSRGRARCWSCGCGCCRSCGRRGWVGGRGGGRGGVGVRLLSELPSLSRLRWGLPPALESVLQATTVTVPSSSRRGPGSSRQKRQPC